MTGSNHMQVQATLSLYSVPQRPPVLSANGGLVRFYNKEAGISFPISMLHLQMGASSPPAAVCLSLVLCRAPLLWKLRMNWIWLRLQK